MEETELQSPSSTLARPPLENAAIGTRALQRFHLGNMRPKPARARAEDLPDEVDIVVMTVKIAVPARIKALPRIYALYEEDDDESTRVPPRRAGLIAAGWALGASASLALACSAAGAVVYALVFP